VAELAGLLKRDHGKKGQTLNLGDVLIAATALHNRVPLLTDNTRDFPMKELSLHPLPK
jgi:predicted nucleic acid-binding protein